jgi:hypothetical protein
MLLFLRKELVVEPQFNYWLGIKRVLNNSYLVGYRQTEKYFSVSALQIHLYLTFQQPLEIENETMSQKKWC